MLANGQSTFYGRRSRASDVVLAPSYEVSAAKRSSRCIPSGIGSTRAMEAGLRFERSVLRYLGEVFSSHLLPHPVLEYKLAGGRRWRLCVPDAIIATPTSHITVVEIKLTHHLGVWAQARGLYAPVASLAFAQTASGRRPVKVLEICRTFDPAICLPEAVTRVSCVRGFHEGGSGFGVKQLTEGEMLRMDIHAL